MTVKKYSGRSSRRTWRLIMLRARDEEQDKEMLAPGSPKHRARMTHRIHPTGDHFDDAGKGDAPDHKT